MATKAKLKFSKEERRALIKAAGEPNIDVMNYRTTLIYALNWYNAEKERKDKVSYVKAFAASVGIDVSHVGDQTLSMFGGISRLCLRGEPILDEDRQKLIDSLKKLPARLTLVDDTAVVPAPKKTSDEIAEERATEIIEELEQAIDATIPTVGAVDFDIKQLLTRAQNSKVMAIVSSHIQRLYDEFSEVQNTTDKQLIEGYSNITKRKLTHIVKFLQSALADSKTQKVVQKARKPRKVKAKPAPVIVKNLKYMKESEELKIKSVNAESIIGAKQVVVFNTKYRKLSVITAAEDLTLSVKGTTIINVDPTLSTSKTLRKPEEMLPAFVNTTKRNVLTAFKAIKTTEREANGRLNEETLILSVNK